MVRRKLEIKLIEDKSKRQVTFTKRRQGLFKKADELRRKCDAEIAIITFSKAGNVYSWGHHSVDAVLQRYLAVNKSNDDHDNHVEEEENHIILDNKIDETRDPSPADHDHHHAPADQDDHENDVHIDEGMGLALTLSPPADHHEKHNTTMAAAAAAKTASSDKKEEEEEKKGDDDDREKGLFFKNIISTNNNKDKTGTTTGNNNNNNILHHEEEEKEHGAGAEVVRPRMMTAEAWKTLNLEDLRIDELERLTAEMEEIKKKILERAHQIQTSSSVDHHHRSPT